MRQASTEAVTEPNEPAGVRFVRRPTIGKGQLRHSLPAQRCTALISRLVVTRCHRRSRIEVLRTSDPNCLRNVRRLSAGWRWVGSDDDVPEPVTVVGQSCRTFGKEIIPVPAPGADPKGTVLGAVLGEITLKRGTRICLREHLLNEEALVGDKTAGLQNQAQRYVGRDSETMPVASGATSQQHIMIAFRPVDSATPAWQRLKLVDYPAFGFFVREHCEPNITALSRHIIVGRQRIKAEVENDPCNMPKNVLTEPRWMLGAEATENPPVHDLLPSLCHAFEQEQEDHSDSEEGSQDKKRDEVCTYRPEDDPRGKRNEDHRADDPDGQFHSAVEYAALDTSWRVACFAGLGYWRRVRCGFRSLSLAHVESRAIPSSHSTVGSTVEM